MAGIKIDEIHLEVFMPRGLSDAASDAAWRTLRGRRFMTTLSRAARGVAKRFPALRRARVALSR